MNTILSYGTMTPTKGSYDNDFCVEQLSDSTNGNFGMLYYINLSVLHRSICIIYIVHKDDIQVIYIHNWFC